MIVADPLFGAVQIPKWLDVVALSPEVQRLREVRLINTSTPSFAALSDTRRYTHAVGVLYLAQQAAPRLRRHVSAEELMALEMAALIHDVGSPPFAHLFEYLLKACTGWSHERMLRRIVEGSYHPTGRYHQVFHGNQLALQRVAESMPEVTNLAVLYTEGEGRLGGLVAGSVDLDNIDNVYRMGHQLGLYPDLSAAPRLARSFGIINDRLTILESVRPALVDWRALRRRDYEVLAFDPLSLQGQAMLTEALTAALQAGTLSESSWFLTDEGLISHLQDHSQPPAVRSIARRFSVGDYFTHVFTGWYRVPQGIDDLRLPSRRAVLAESLSDAVGFECVPYVFYDQGTFEKALELDFLDEATGATRRERLGVRSRSTVVTVTTPRRTEPAGLQLDRITQTLRDFGLDPEFLIELPDKRKLYGLDEQDALPL